MIGLNRNVTLNPVIIVIVRAFCVGVFSGSWKHRRFAIGIKLKNLIKLVISVLFKL